jgi:serine/threonine protein kinase
MLVGHLPFQAESRSLLSEKVVKGSIAIPPKLSREADELIRLLLTVDPRGRPTLREIMQHPWFHSGRLIRYNLHDAKFDYRLSLDTEVVRCIAKLGYFE